MILCPICSEQIKDRKGLSLHLTKRHKSSFSCDKQKEELIVFTLFGEQEVLKIVEEYKNEMWCIYNLPIDIGKYIDLLGMKRSSKQERATTRYKEKYIKGIQAIYGDNIINISQVKEIKEKKEKTYIKNYGSYENYLENQRNHMLVGYNEYLNSEHFLETHKKIKQNNFVKYGHENFGQSKGAKEKSKITRKQTVDSWSYQEKLERTAYARSCVSSRGGYSSKPEKRVRKSLIDLDIESEYNKMLWNYNWDLVIGNIIIEVQGVMWHAKPDRYKPNDLIMGKILAQSIWDKDKRKRIKAESENYTVIEIWEDEISCRNDEQLCEFVKIKLMENGYEFCD